MLLLLLLLCCVSPALGSKFNKNKLFPEYGINFRYIGEIKNRLDQVSVVTSVPLPHFKDIHISPLKFHNCSMDMNLDSAISKEHRRLQIAVSKWCAKAMLYMQHLRKKEKYFVDRLHGLLENDLYSVLPQLRRGSQAVRPRQGLGTLVISAVTGLITLTVESLGSYFRNKQEKWINNAVLAMREDNTVVQNTLQQYSNDFLMYGRYNVETLEKVIQTVNSLHHRQTQLEEVFAKTQSGCIDEVIDTISLIMNCRSNSSFVIIRRVQISLARFQTPSAHPYHGYLDGLPSGLFWLALIFWLLAMHKDTIPPLGCPNMPAPGSTAQGSIVPSPNSAFTPVHRQSPTPSPSPFYDFTGYRMEERSFLSSLCDEIGTVSDLQTVAISLGFKFSRVEQILMSFPHDFPAAVFATLAGWYTTSHSMFCEKLDDLEGAFKEMHKGALFTRILNAHSVALQRVSSLPQIC